jgi:uncharacterized protein
VPRADSASSPAWREVATFVAVAHLQLRMPWVHSLKAKRGLVVPMVEGLRRRYPLAVARVAGQDAHDWERLALVAVGTDPDALRGVMEAAERFVLATGVDLAWRRVEIEAWDDDAAS